MANWSFSLWDIKTDTLLADLSDYALAWSLSPRLNRPLSLQLTLPSDQAFLHAISLDGDPALHVGTRAIKAHRNGVLKAHEIVWVAGYKGGPDNDPRVQLTCLDSMIRLNYRHVFDATGRLSDPVFDDPITAGDLLTQAISYSRTYEDNFGIEALLPIDTFSGTFSATVNVASLLADTPLTIGDLINLLTESGVVDVVFKPVDSSGFGYAPGIMSQLNVYDEAGSDRSGDVHFDYGVGDKNCSEGERVIDCSTLGNRITFELGPKLGKSHYRGNITGTELSPVDLSAYQALALASRGKYGTYAEVKVFDSDDANDARPLFHELWKTETLLRNAPRDLLYLTPQADHPLGFQPYDDYDLGDLVAVNTGVFLGLPIGGAKQRVYGFDISWSAEDPVERVGQLITSADAEGGP